MPRSSRILALAAVLAIGGARRSQAQYVVSEPRTVIMTQPIPAGTATVVTPTGPFSSFRTRREARRDKRARYLAMRPAYSIPTGNQIGFNPFSDRYVGPSDRVVTPPPPFTVAPR